MLRLHPTRKTYSADLRHRTFGRVHLHLLTKNKEQAGTRHAALVLLLNSGEAVRDIVAALRAQKISIVAVTECVRAQRPFDTLRGSVWPTLGEAKDEYLSAIEGRAKTSENTWRSTRSALTRAVDFFGADKRLETVTHEDVAAYKRHLTEKPPETAAHGKKRVQLHTNSVALYLTKFGALYTFLQKRENKRAAQFKRPPAVLFSPLDWDEHMPDIQKTRVRFLSEQETERLLTATPERLKLAVALGVFAGLRINEILLLRHAVDIDREAGVVKVQARDGWKPKYGRNRDVPISSALAPYLNAHLADLPAGSVYLFPGTDGAHLPDKRLQQAFLRIAAAAGLEAGRKAATGVTVHTLRHTFASWLVMAGADLFTVARLMGHTSTKQVEAVYAHLSPKHQRATVELLSARWARRETETATTSATTNTPNHA